MSFDTAANWETTRPKSSGELVREVYAVSEPTVFDPHVHARCPKCNSLLGFWAEDGLIPERIREGHSRCSDCGWRPSRQERQRLLKAVRDADDAEVEFKKRYGPH